LAALFFIAIIQDNKVPSIFDAGRSFLRPNRRFGQKWRMTKSDLKKFKEELEKTKTDLEASLNTFAKKDPTLKGDWDSKFPEYSREDPNVNLEEEADAVTEYLTRLPVEHSYELRLKAINEALGRIKRGTYGNCSSCEAKIPQKRLEAYPEADLCLKCKK
jgi:DnaK suppressor protein